MAQFNWFAGAAAPCQHGSPRTGESAMGVLDDYMVSPEVSLMDKTCIQAQVLVPVLRALREELGRGKGTRSTDARCASGRMNCLRRSARVSTGACAANGRRCRAPTMR